jgi:L-malate glycosyltransferase
MTLRVAIVALYPAPEAKAPGGVRAVVQNLVRGLRGFADLQISVVHCHADVDESLVREEGNLRLEYIAMPKRRLIPNALVSVRRIETALRRLQPDVVNAHAAHYALAGLRAGIPTVFTIHGVVRREAEIYRHTWFDRARFALETGFEDRALRQVKDIVAISDYVVQQYTPRTAAHFHRIDNPLAPEFYALHDAGEEGRLLYAGTIDERKNVLDLVRAVAIVREQLPSVRLAIAGRTTQPDYEAQVRALVAADNLDQQVEFLGLQNAEQMLRQYARCRAVVLFSLQETAPMAVLEAMASGKAVVCSRVGGTPELVQDGSSGFLVEPRDIDGLARRLVLVLQDRNLALKMGDQGRLLADRFRGEAVAARYRDLYYQVARKDLP